MTWNKSSIRRFQAQGASTSAYTGSFRNWDAESTVMHETRRSNLRRSATPANFSRKDTTAAHHDVDAAQEQPQGAAPNKMVTPEGSSRSLAASAVDPDVYQSDDDITKIVDNVPSDFLIHIHTEPDGYNSGRIYHLAATSQEDCDTWLHELKTAIVDAKCFREAQSRIGCFSRIRAVALEAYMGSAAQQVIGFLITLNFIVSVVEAELHYGREDAWKSRFDNIEIAFTTFFSIELLLNFIAAGPFRYIQSAPFVHALCCILK